jgi:hypothetical protein
MEETAVLAFGESGFVPEVGLTEEMRAKGETLSSSAIFK